MQLSNCIAAVTGGASGLGEACVRLFASFGAKAAIFDVNAQAGERLASELGPNVIFLPCDITKEESASEAVDRAVADLGGLNIAVNCAGVSYATKVFSKRGPAPLAPFNQVVQINLIGTFNIIRLALAKMVKNPPNEDGERGVIINTASAAAFEGQIGQSAYSASKAGIVGMTLPIARECADYGVRVVTIAPGLFDTPMLALLPQEIRDALGGSVPFPKRLGRPAEYAMLVRQIIENPMLNGNTIRLDGAIRMTAR